MTAKPANEQDYTPAFLAAVEAVLVPEGVLSEDNRDDGGTTAYGISARAHPDIDILSLTRDGAIALYWSRYWLLYGCYKLEYPLACVVFDGVVQHGDLGIKMLQRAVRVAEDGHLGPVTIAAIERDPLFGVMATYMAHRIADIYVLHHDWNTDRIGWMRRLFLAALHGALDPVEETPNG